MSLSSGQQFTELLKKATRPVILLPAYPSTDALATAFALAHFLEEQNKEPLVAGETLLEDQARLAFLTPPKDLKKALSGVRDFVLAFNTTRNDIVSVRTERDTEEFRILLTPEHGTIDPRDFSFMPARFTFDLAIVIGTPDTEHLGGIYDHNPDIFYEMPIINIDHETQNELLGQLNLVDVKASGCAEILGELLLEQSKSGLSETVGEALLTGIIAATESFQKKNTTPKGLRVASQLMQAGADQQKIIRALYKTQPLHLLKLWGRAMAQVKWNEELKLVWSPVTLEDLVQARASYEDLPLVLEKMRANYAAGQLFVILTPEDQTGIKGLAKAATPELLATLVPLFPESRLLGDTLHFRLSAQSLDAAEEMLFEKLLPRKKTAS